MSCYFWVPPHRVLKFWRIEVEEERQMGGKEGQSEGEVWERARGEERIRNWIGFSTQQVLLRQNFGSVGSGWLVPGVKKDRFITLPTLALLCTRRLSTRPDLSLLNQEFWDRWTTLPDLIRIFFLWFLNLESEQAERIRYWIDFSMQQVLLWQNYCLVDSEWLVTGAKKDRFITLPTLALLCTRGLSTRPALSFIESGVLRSMNYTGFVSFFMISQSREWASRQD